MKILFLSNRVPYPPNKGERIRSYHEIAELSRRHEVHLATMAETGSDEESVAYLRTQCTSVGVTYRSSREEGLAALGALFSGRPLSIAAFDSRPFRHLVAERIRSVRPDILFAYTAAVAPYLEGISGTPRVIDFVDADSEKYRVYSRLRGFPQSLLYAFEADRLARFEGHLASEFEASIVVTGAEADIVRRLAPSREITVLPNGVDLELFHPPARSAQARRPDIVFTGVMGYYPNVDAVTYFAREAMPLVRAQVPDARFLIVGRDPVGSVRRLAELPGVVVTGTVPDVRPYLAGAAMAVAPFRIARGVQNKILEGMASGLPVVGTSLAFQGLAATREDGVRMADSPEALAEAVVGWLRNEGERQERGRGARRFVERHHHWGRFGERLEARLLSLVA